MDGLPPLKESIPVEEDIGIMVDAIEKKQNGSEKLPSSLASNFERNSLLPISRLPPEIVHHIFALVQKTELDSIYLDSGELDRREQGQARLKWINLTHVCRQWRDIGLNSPTLWVHLPIGNLRWVEEMLRRSKASGLWVEYSLCGSLPHSGLELAFEHFQRIKALLLWNVPQAKWLDLQKRLPMSAPQLESLCIEGEISDSIRPDNSRDFKPLPISRDILCQTEKLRKLELLNCEVDWSSHSNLLRSLSHLTLTATSALTETWLMEILKGMPELESLELLEGALHIRTGGQASWSSENIYLSRLRNLEISSGFLEVDTFFRLVTFPPTATVCVVCLGEPNPDFSIFGLARSYSNATPEIHFQSLIISHAIPFQKGVQLKLFSEAVEESIMIACWHEDAIPDLELVFFADHLTDLLGDIFNSAIPLHNITHLYLAERVDWFTTNMVANMLGTLPRLHSVVVGGEAVRPFFEAMRLDLQVDPAGSSGNAVQTMVYFPRVSSICIYDFLFLESWQPPIQYMGRTVGLMSMELLRDFLMERCELGVPVNTLIVRHCLGTRRPSISLEKDVKLLKEIVVDVDWDGHEYGVQKKWWEDDSEEEDEEDYDQEEEEDEEDEVDDYSN